jgi:hypothetical protein
MNGWSVAREPEKPKTVTGKRLAAIANAEAVYVRVVQQGEAARVTFGRTAPVTETFFQAAQALRELIDLMPQRAIE